MDVHVICIVPEIGSNTSPSCVPCSYIYTTKRHIRCFSQWNMQNNRRTELWNLEKVESQASEDVRNFIDFLSRNR